MNTTPTPRDGELLSAYLAGDLDEHEAARLEARLAREPELAARLEATRVVVEGLMGLDEVELPDGFSERLHARLVEERAAPTVAGPVDLAEARARRTERLRQRWPALTAAAAGVVGVAVLGAAALVGLQAGDVMEVAEEPAAEAPELEALDAPDQGVGDDAAVPDAAPEEARSAPSEPLLVDSQTPLADAEAARGHFAGTPAGELLGLPVEDAEDLAAGFGVALQRGDPFDSGAEPGACLDAVQAGAEQPVVPAHVESVRYEDQDALAYVTATARAEASTLDRLELWVVEPDTCATRLFVELTPDG